MCVTEAMQRFAGRTCAVIGLGTSNRPLVDFLLRFGARVTVRDQKDPETLGTYVDDLRRKGVGMRFGKGYLDDLCEDFIFRSPGIRPDLTEMALAVERGAVLTSEMELFLELTPARVIGITGSDGKTTTTTVTGKLLEAECQRSGHGRVFVGGNIGTPLLPLVEEMTPDDFCVVELSSFQLQTAKRSTERAALTNLSENHLNWHVDMDEYVAAKTNIYRHAPNRLLVTNAENSFTVWLGKAHTGAVTWFSSRRTCHTDFADLMRAGDRAVYCRDGMIYLWDGEEERPMLEMAAIAIRGLHNLENYMTAIGLTEGLVSKETLTEVATDFHGVRHRCEYVRTVDGVAYYNSSIDSSPTRTRATLSAMEARPIVIVGGRNKKFEFAPLAKTLCQRAKAVVLTGEIAPLVREALENDRTETGRGLPTYEHPDFEGAVRLAREIATEGDTVLLSPSATSFDAFCNFEARGDRFCDIVRGFSEKSTKGE